MNQLKSVCIAFIVSICAMSAECQTRLTITKIPGTNRCMVSWPGLTTKGYQLQSRTNLATGIWNNRLGIQLGLGTNRFTNTSARPSEFFRLIETNALWGKYISPTPAMGTEVTDTFDLVVDAYAASPNTLNFVELLDIVEGETNQLGWLDERYGGIPIPFGFSIDPHYLKTGVTHQLVVHIVDDNGDKRTGEGVFEYYTAPLVIIPRVPLSFNWFGQTGWKFHAEVSSFYSNAPWTATVTNIQYGTQLLAQSGNFVNGQTIVEDTNAVPFEGYPGVDWMVLTFTVSPPAGVPITFEALSTVTHRGPRVALVLQQNGILVSNGLSNFRRAAVATVQGLGHFAPLWNVQTQMADDIPRVWNVLSNDVAWSIATRYMRGDYPSRPTFLDYYGGGGAGFLGSLEIGDTNGSMQIATLLEVGTPRQALTFFWIMGCKTKGSLLAFFAQNPPRSAEDVWERGMYPSCGFISSGTENWSQYYGQPDIASDVASFKVAFYNAIRRFDNTTFRYPTCAEALAIAHTEVPSVPLPKVIGWAGMSLAD